MGRRQGAGTEHWAPRFVGQYDKPVGGIIPGVITPGAATSIPPAVHAAAVLPVLGAPS